MKLRLVTAEQFRQERPARRGLHIVHARERPALHHRSAALHNHGSQNRRAVAKDQIGDIPESLRGTVLTGADDLLDLGQGLLMKVKLVHDDLCSLETARKGDRTLGCGPKPSVLSPFRTVSWHRAEIVEPILGRGK